MVMLQFKLSKQDLAEKSPKLIVEKFTSQKLAMKKSRENHVVILFDNIDINPIHDFFGDVISVQLQFC